MAGAAATTGTAATAGATGSAATAGTAGIREPVRRRTAARRTPRHEIRALLRAHLAAATGYRHLTRHCAVCARLLRLAMEPVTAPPAPGPAGEPAGPSGPPSGPQEGPLRAAGAPPGDASPPPRADAPSAGASAPVRAGRSTALLAKDESPPAT
ncbi:DUF6274 family protein [Streptomyces sp. NPDC049967]|uniref:DUF6274 family protein n=1 Tax=Streptomyces sp. NPDC049967 TaxID=3155658 RepID=UPI002E1326B1|nr:DUF6274 family protein [Streptomyces sp. NBC_01324]